jgi:hypothetical protein
MTLTGQRPDRNSAVQRKGSRPVVGRRLFLWRLMHDSASSATAACAASRVLRCRQKLLLRCVAAERGSVQAIGCATATAKTSHRLHELRG